MDGSEVKSDCDGFVCLMFCCYEHGFDCMHRVNITSLPFGQTRIG